MTYQGATVKYDPREQDDVLDIFATMLRDATRDGGVKRAAGLKPPWYIDPSHEAALFSHLNKWKHGELKDADSGAHPLVHLAWRALAIAYQETHRNEPLTDPDRVWDVDRETMDYNFYTTSYEWEVGMDARSRRPR